MLNTKPTSRAAEIRAALKSTSTDLDAARSALGTAVADGDDAAAADARAEVARLERQHAEFSAALPVAERRAREAAQAEAQRAQKAREKAANAARKQRVAAAKKVDAALRALGRAYDDMIALDSGGKPGDASRLIRRSKSALAAAILLQAPQLALALDVRRVMSMHRRTLEDATAGSVGEYPEDDAE